MSQSELVARIALLENILDDAARLIEYKTGYVPGYIYDALLDMPRHREVLDAAAQFERIERWMMKSNVTAADLQLNRSIAA